MIQKFQAASLWAKVGYVSLVVTVLLGLGNVSGKVWGVALKADARYAKQLDLDKTNVELAMVQRDLKSDRLLQLEQQLFDMEIRYGADKNKWSDAQRALYFQKKAERDALKFDLKKKK